MNQNDNKFPPIPTDLAGFQNVETGTIVAGDLLIPTTTGGSEDWQWADGLIGSAIRGGRSPLETFRVYRKMPVVHQSDTHVDETPSACVGDTNTVPGFTEIFPDKVSKNAGPSTLEELEDYFAKTHVACDGVGGVGIPVSTARQKARTDDADKPPLAYLPWAGLQEVAMVQLYGQKKYGSFWNYRNGMEVGRNISCAIRHLVAYMEGEDKDPESGSSHLAHATCRLLFVLQNMNDGKAIDDRYKRALGPTL